MERVNWGVLVLPHSTEFDVQTKRIAISISIPANPHVGSTE